MSSIQRKRNIVDISRKQDECVGTPMKKSANRAGRGCRKATENISMPHLESQIRPEISPAKVKLQLFPVNEETRARLEKDDHNPFLELTLSARKRISSVVKHLNNKWSNSTVNLGQLMLFPYNTKLEQLASSKRWTLNDSAITAWEAYVDVGSPSIFRLRYGWFSNFQHQMFDFPPRASLLETHADSEGRKRGCEVLDISNHQDEKLDESCGTLRNQTELNDVLHSDVNEQKALDVPTGFGAGEATEAVSVLSSVPWDDNLTNLSIGGLLSEISMQGKINNSDTKSGMQPIGLISDISIGDLLSETSLFGKISTRSTRLENESSLQHISLTSGDMSLKSLLSDASLHSNKNKLVGHAQIQSPWYDDLTALSIGGLFSEASLQAKARGDLELKEDKSSLQLNTPIFDSSDSLISSRLKTPLHMPKPSSHETNMSILDAEETCHAFPVRKIQTDRDTIASNIQSSIAAKMNNETVFPKDFSCQELKTSRLPRSPGASNEDSILKAASHQSE